MAWLSGWDYRIELAIGDYAGDIGAAVTWFPVTIFLKDTNGDSTKVFLEVGANSRKIAITKADGDTELKGEIEDWSYDAGTPANSTAVIHTSADGWTINANTSIWLYYDNDHADNANVDVINTAAGAAVWDGNFEMVYHMVDDNGNVDDSTSNNNDGTKKGVGEPAEVAGKVGQGQHFDADYITPATDLIPGANFTAEFIIRADTIHDGRIMDKNAGAGNRGWYFSIKDDTTDMELRFFNSANGTDYLATNSTNANLAVETYYHIAVVKIGTAITFYLNGTALTDDGEAVYTDTATSSENFVIGAYLSTVGTYDGILDETKYSDTNRSAAWLKGTYNSLWDTLLTYGSQEPPEEVEVNAIWFGANF